MEFGKEIDNTTRDYHALLVVLQVGMPVLGKSFCIGDITIIVYLVPGITLTKIFRLRTLLMILAAFRATVVAFSMGFSFSHLCNDLFGLSDVFTFLLLVQVAPSPF